MYNIQYVHMLTNVQYTVHTHVTNVQYTVCTHVNKCTLYSMYTF